MQRKTHVKYSFCRCSRGVPGNLCLPISGDVELRNFKILKQWNPPKGKAAGKLNEMREFWELSKDDEEWSSDGSYF